MRAWLELQRPVCVQDVVAGDGTTSVTVVCGALLNKCLDLLARGVHPTIISDAFAKAAARAGEVAAQPLLCTCQSNCLCLA